jgi:hypothetical protein
MNRFLYAQANPATLIDPSGHAACMRFIDGACQGYHSTAKTGTRTRADVRHARAQRERRDETRSTSRRTILPGLTNRQAQALRVQVRARRAEVRNREALAARGTAAAQADRRMAEPTPVKQDDGFGGFVHTVLDFGGMVPVLGAVPDLLNSGIYAAEGNYLEAGISAAAAIPFAGDAVGAGRLAIKYGDDVLGAASHLVDDAASAATKAADDVAAAGSRGSDFIAGPDGTIIPTNPTALRDNLARMQDTSINPDISRKFTGTDSVGRPVRARVDRAHPTDPGFRGRPDPLHGVDHLHIERRSKGLTGSWVGSWKVELPWPF